MQRITPLHGGIAAIVASAGIFVSNFFHPFPPGERTAMLEVVAGESSWSLIHLPVMFFVVAMVWAFTAIADAMPAGRPASLARIGWITALVGAPVMLAGTAIDGYGFKALADAWMQAPPDQKPMLLAAADAVVTLETGLVHTWVAFLLGLSTLCFGMALQAARTFPRALGWLAMLGGAGTLASGVSGFLRLPLVLPFPVFGTLVLAWMFGMGVVLVRRSTDPARTHAPI